MGRPHKTVIAEGLFLQHQKPVEDTLLFEMPPHGISLEGVEKELIWSARNMGATDRELMWQIVLPAALPQILTGLQVALPISMIVAVVAEMLMGGYGLGGAMMTASRFADSRGVFAGIVEIAIVGYVLIKLMSMLRRRLLVWHQEANEPTTA